MVCLLEQNESAVAELYPLFIFISCSDSSSVSSGCVRQCCGCVGVYRRTQTHPSSLRRKSSRDRAKNLPPKLQHDTSRERRKREKCFPAEFEESEVKRGLLQ
uniref:Uncharacterized protein n=1 Tax=Knipowitschia caucasica TaxID=637954 RepID=A0AAV2JYT9_KNICA